MPRRKKDITESYKKAIERLVEEGKLEPIDKDEMKNLSIKDAVKLVSFGRDSNTQATDKQKETISHFVEKGIIDKKFGENIESLKVDKANEIIEMGFKNFKENGFKIPQKVNELKNENEISKPTEKQREKILELINKGVLSPFPEKTWENLTREQALKTIKIGMIKSLEKNNSNQIQKNKGKIISPKGRERE